MPNKTNSVRGATGVLAQPPQPSPTLTSRPNIPTHGYGSSGFGNRATVPTAPAQTTAPVAALTTAPAAATASTAAPAVEQASERALHGRMPLTLTIVGVVIFIGGVSGLFIYALSGM